MIKLQTDFDLSTVIEKRGRYPGGANILAGRCPVGGGGKCPRDKCLGGGASDCNPFISVLVSSNLL